MTFHHKLSKTPHCAVILQFLTDYRSFNLCIRVGCIIAKNENITLLIFG